MDRMLMLSEDPQSAKTIVFSDSRQEAARLAGDLERDHWSDLARSLTLDILEKRRNEQFELRLAFEASIKVRAVGAAPQASASDYQALRILMERLPALYDWVVSDDAQEVLQVAPWVEGNLDMDSLPPDIRSLVEKPPLVPLASLDLELAEALLERNACPVGPHPERLMDDEPRPWWQDLPITPGNTVEADLRLLRSRNSFGPASLNGGNRRPALQQGPVVPLSS